MAIKITTYLTLSAVWLLSAGDLHPAEVRSAQELLSLSGVRGGLVVHLGCGDGQLTAALHVSDSYLVQGLDSDPQRIESGRRRLQDAGLYGPVTLEPWHAAFLPYADNLVNLAVVEDPGAVPMGEIMRVLAPLGVACLKSNGTWTTTVKAWPKELDEWTHFMHGPDNNAVAHDSAVGPPKYLQWLAEPLFCRSHEIDSGVSALVSARGRLFYILDEGPTGLADQRFPEKWALVARDAFSGVLLWKTPLPHWGWTEWKKELLLGKDWTTVSRQRVNFPATLPKRLVADGDKVYVTLGFHAPVSQVEAATGTTLQTFAGTENADEIICASGLLLVCTRPNHGGPTKDSLLALNPATRQIIWKQEGLGVRPLSLAADAGRVVYSGLAGIVCLDQKTGQMLWNKPGLAARASGNKKKASEGVVAGWQWRVTETLLIQNGIVLSMADKLEALSLETGKLLWTSRSPPGAFYDLAPDLFVAGGLVWHGLAEGGLDLKTGALKQRIDVKNLISVGHHPRCYPSKATDNYLIWHKQGAEFVDLRTGSNHMRNDWMRGPCRYGVLPCNGLLYVAPHQCKCYVGVKLSGFNALSARKLPSSPPPAPSPRLESGPALATLPTLSAQVPAADDWPAYRHDAARSGSVKSSMPAAVSPLWQIKLGGKLSQPVVANGQLLVCSLDTQRLLAFDAKTGKPQWTFTPGGRVDSPPTYYHGTYLFGSADGWVYCVRAADGVLAWRFRAAPEERRVVAFARLESPWPVHGSVLVQAGVAYAVAGRSSFLDGGLYLVALDPATGRLLHEAGVEGPYPDVVHDPGGSGFMNGASSDVLVGDGKFVYLRQLKFTADLQQIKPPASLSPRERRQVGLHLMASSSLLDDSGFNRIGWTYGDTWPIGQGSPILSFNATTTYAVQPFTQHQAQSQVYFPATGCIQLFASRNGSFSENLETDSENDNPLSGENAPPKAAKPLTKKEKKTGKKPPTVSDLLDAASWSATIPVRARAMVLTEHALFIAGPPDVFDPQDPLGAFEGRKGSLLWAVSTRNGKPLAQTHLDAEPAFDGLIAAGGRLVLTTKDGRIICLSATTATP